MVKKIAVLACLFPLLFSLVFSNLRIGHTSAASDFSSTYFYGQNLYNYDESYKPDLFSTALSGAGLSSNYLIMAGWMSASQSEPWRFVDVVVFSCNLNICSVTSTADNVYSVSIVSGGGRYNYFSYACTNTSYVPNYDRGGNKYNFGGSTYYVTLNLNDNTLSYDASGTPQTFRLFAMDSDDDIFNPNALDVDVYFSPSLSGDVDLTSVPSVAIGEQVNTSVITDLYWTITNNSRSNIQYAINITSADGIVWRYLAYEWCLTSDITADQDSSHYSDNAALLNAFQPLKQFMGSRWHLVALDSTPIDSVTVKWQNLPLQENITYTVEVEAALVDYDYVIVPAYEYAALNMPVPYEPEIVYSSTFTITNKGGITFSPSSNSYSNSIIYEDEGSYYTALGKRKAVEHEDGSFDYNDVDIYSDPDSWVNNADSSVLSTIQSSMSGGYNVGDMLHIGGSSYNGYSLGGGSGGYSVASVSGASSYVGGFFSFLGSVFSFFPAAWLQIISLGFVAILAIGIIKAVIK